CSCLYTPFFSYYVRDHPDLHSFPTRRSSDLWDAANNLVQSYYGKLPLKGHAIWGGSQLSGYLDLYEEIRRRFTAYLTPGDVLARSEERRVGKEVRSGG